MGLVHKILPLVIKDKEGQILEVSLSNKKGFNKSLERDHLWHIHKETGKLLPYSETSLLNISEHSSWYEAILSIGKKHKTSHNQKELFNFPKDDIKYNGGIGTLGLLQNLLLKRKRELPEGSYTTHLFQSGAEKIRKKTGEEAIELILASGRSEIIYESADLIYHMLILLLSEDIFIDEVLTELEKRAVKG